MSLQGDHPSGLCTLHSHAHPAMAATCPPYWMMFSSPQESRAASGRSSQSWESIPRPRSRSLNEALCHATTDPTKSAVSNSYSDDEETSPKEKQGPGWRSLGLTIHGMGTKDLCSRCSSKFLTMPCDLSPCGLPSHRWTNTRQTSLPCNFPNILGSDDDRGSSHKCPVSLVEHPCTFRCTTPTAEAVGSHAIPRDSSVELLSALSSEEQRLLDAVTEQGYPIRTAIVALQKTRQGSPEEILSYLVACERLCEEGYDKAQVEEALEIFHNCEAKAAEFLCLLTQFREMGFQENAIKEVLLVHENHRERALEDLMMHVI
ncbi:ubiquitin-associated protein 1 [Brachyhypopomus gauderio]|uniref:ubiquitin-associated protein 1 n=1 Tax=Brachyhypopomus gauderio TaxID=698409 RepID=UPI0040413A5F